jgi:hypothetical protein
MMYVSNLNDFPEILLRKTHDHSFLAEPGLVRRSQGVASD